MAKTPLEIRSLARAHTQTALKVLHGVMTSDDAPHAARVSAATAMLDRGWGKATQTLAGDPEQPIEHRVRWATSQSEATKDPSRGG